MEFDEKEVSHELDAGLAQIPNLLLDEVPEGKDSEDNVEHHRFGAQRNYDFAPKQHFELGEALRQMDFEAAAKLSGARFVVLKKGWRDLSAPSGNSCSTSILASMATRRSIRRCSCTMT